MSWRKSRNIPSGQRPAWRRQGPGLARPEDSGVSPSQGGIWPRLTRPREGEVWKEGPSRRGLGAGAAPQVSLPRMAGRLRYSRMEFSRFKNRPLPDGTQIRQTGKTTDRPAGGKSSDATTVSVNAGADKARGTRRAAAESPLSTKASARTLGPLHPGHAAAPPSLCCPRQRGAALSHMPGSRWGPHPGAVGLLGGACVGAAPLGPLLQRAAVPVSHGPWPWDCTSGLEWRSLTTASGRGLSPGLHISPACGTGGDPT